MTETVTAPSEAAAPAVETTTTTGSGTTTEAGGEGESTAGSATGNETTGGADSASGDATDAGQSTEAGSDTAAGTDVLSLSSYDFTLPEGFEANPDAMNEFKQLALDSKLPPAAAQKLVDLYASASQSAMTALQTHQAAAFEAQQDTWRAEVAQLDGFRTQAQTDKSLETIGKLIEDPRFCPDTAAFKSIMTTTGAGNHPVLVQTLLNLANALNEGAPSTPGRSVAQPGDRKNGRSLSYPNTPELNH